MNVVIAVELLPVIASAVIAVAVFVLAMTLLSMDHEHRSDLEKRLTGYAGSQIDAEMAEAADREGESSIMQDMFALTGRMAERVGVLNRVEDKLEQADLPLRPPEALFVYIAIVVLTFVASLFLFGPILGLGFTVAAIFGPAMYLEMRRKKRLRKFETQLPDVLNLLSGSMRAGFSFAQGLEAVAE